MIVKKKYKYNHNYRFRKVDTLDSNIAQYQYYQEKEVKKPINL